MHTQHSTEQLCYIEWYNNSDSNNNNNNNTNNNGNISKRCLQNFLLHCLVRSLVYRLPSRRRHRRRWIHGRRIVGKSPFRSFIRLNERFLFHLHHDLAFCRLDRDSITLAFFLFFFLSDIGEGDRVGAYGAERLKFHLNTTCNIYFFISVFLFLLFATIKHGNNNDSDGM